MRKLSILIAVAMVAAVVPATEAGPVDDVAPDIDRWIIGFHGYPDYQPGDTYLGHTVVEVNNPLKYIVIETGHINLVRSEAMLDEDVRYIELESIDWELHMTPDDYFYTHAAHWGSKRIGGEAAWDVTLGTTAVKVAHIDSGINRGHEEFAGQSRVLQGYDFYNNDNDPDDMSGCDWHGSHTTSTAGSTINNGLGIAGMSQHTILPVKIFHYSGGGIFGGCGTTTTAITNALQYAADQGAHLSSNSWGGGASSTAINDAIAYAHGKGTIHVTSAGNSGPCTNCVGQPWIENGDKSIIVTSLTDGDTFSDFSSQGPQVDIIAPGDYIAGVGGGTNEYIAMSGTSMAAPHVTGALALYLAVNPGSTYNQVTNALTSTAEDMGMAPERQGDGLVRADLLVAGGGGGGGNNAPTSSFTYTCTDLSCDFDGTGSSDPDGDTLSYSWDFGDGNTATGATASHTYAADGTYTATLTVSDANGGSDSSSQSVSVASSGGGGSGITATGTGYKVKGVHHVDLEWSGATSTNVDIVRNGAVVTTTANDGFYTDNTGNKGGASYDYQVCEAGTTTCSNTVTVVF